MRAAAAPVRLAAFAAGLALLGGAAALLGSATGGGRVAAAPAAEMEMHAASPAATGLSTSAGGLTFVPERTALPLGRTSEFRFRIVDEHDRPQRRFDLDGGVRVHLIVVRRDLTGYQHLHPALAPDGSWSTPLALPDPGAYRAFVDVERDGEKIVLGSDVFVAGTFAPQPVPPVRATDSVDGYDLALARHGSELRFTVRRGGRLVRDFQPYVGERAHLVALRAGDLQYSHVHGLPVTAPGRIHFEDELAPGTYRLFLQFKTEGVVRTAEFTVQVPR